MKNKVLFGLLLMMLVISMVGCSGAKKDKGADDNSNTNSSDSAKKIYDEAVEQLNKAELKGMVVTKTNEYDNEMSDEEKYTCIYDSKANIIERYSDPDADTTDSFQYFNVKEDDGTYMTYVLDESTAYDWVCYEEQLEDDDISQFDEHANSFDPSFKEENGYRNIIFSDEEEESVDDKDCYKITVKAEYASETSDSDEYTREDVLSDYEITEDAVALVDGFSEILDNYVKATNGEGDSSIKYTQTAWISKSDGQFVKVETASDDGEMEKESDSDQWIQKFLDQSYKVSMAQGYLDDGMSKEEAKAALEKEISEIEGSSDDEESGAMVGMTEDDSDETEGDDGKYYMFADSTVIKETVTKLYTLGNDCPDLDGIPENVSATSQSEFFSE